MASRWMYDHARRLVDDEQSVVLKQDVQCNGLGGHGGWFGRRPADANLLSGTRMMCGLGGLAIDADVTRLDQAL